MSKEVGEMVRSRDVVQAEGSARTEGARRATGVRADDAAAGAGSLAPGQRWSASRKRDVVLRLLRGESLEALSREAGVEIYRLDAWRERAMAGLELGLKARHGEPGGGDARRGEAAHRGAVDGDRAAPRAGPGPRSSAVLPIRRSKRRFAWRTGSIPSGLGCRATPVRVVFARTGEREFVQTSFTREGDAWAEQSALTFRRTEDSASSQPDR